MKTYIVTVPPTWEQGSFKCFARDRSYESKNQSALSQYNSARAHDGLPPVKRMPAGTIYKPMKLCAVAEIKQLADPGAKGAS